MMRAPEGRLFWMGSFPTQAHRDAFFSGLRTRTDAEVKLLLRCFLVRTGSNPIDEFDADFTIQQIRSGALKAGGLSEHQRRHVLYAASGGKFPVWEGVHWVLDLLPHQPRRALDVLDAFTWARAMSLKDSYLSGLYDAEALIRAFYIASPLTSSMSLSVLKSLSWRELEWLCGVLYEHMGFNVTVTPRSNDDGIDVLAVRETLGQRERVAVSAKQKAGAVGKADWRELLGAITDYRATRGVLVTTGPLESGVRKKEAQEPRIQVIEAGQLVEMLNEHVGSDWHRHVDRLMSELRRKQNKSDESPPAP
jgi:restriction system protein